MPVIQASSPSRTPTSPATQGHSGIRPLSENFLAILFLVGISALLTAALDVPRVRSDGFAYYVWIEALVRDHTVNLTAAARHYAPYLTYQVIIDPRTGRVASAFAFGSAILWSPFYAVALLLDPVRGLGFHARDAAFLAAQGDTFLNSLAISLGTWVYVTVALVLSFLLARRLVGVKTAVFVVLATFVGTPLYYYTAIEPTMAHGVATFVVTLVIWLVARSPILPLNHRDAVPSANQQRRAFGPAQAFSAFRGVRYWLIVGLAIGLAGTVRWQLILLAVPIGLTLLTMRRFRELGACASGSALLFVAVPCVWWYQFGSPSPTAVGTIHTWLPSACANVLVTPVSGMFVWSPVTLLGVFGIVGLTIVCPRRSGILLLVFLIFEVVISAMAGDGTAGASFGMRRLTEVYPIFVIGIAWLIQHMSTSSATLRNLTYAAIVVCTAFTTALFLTYIRALIDPVTGTVIDAILVWLPPHTAASFEAVRSIHLFGFGSY